ncbi:hypothetical protein ACHAWO_004214 [Cyclotella atomus]|uniref:Uncharacterized protein n=1 Tax=Cyclotella atomus TaxID=382360 RepID=A0ABD3N8C6_9STRA
MFHPRIARRLRERRCKRRLRLLLHVGCLLCLLTVAEQGILRGRFFGAKNIARTRKEVASIWEQLGCYQQRAYRMDTDQFHDLHAQLLPQLEEQFPTKRSRGKTPNGPINTKLRLSAALRFAAGSSPLDIMLTHGISHQSVYDSIWGTTDAVNKTKSLDFNADGAEFPSHGDEVAGGRWH